jgi:hypothetical protein
LALFGRRPQERVDSVVIPASKNLHKAGPRRVQQKVHSMLGNQNDRTIERSQGPTSLLRPRRGPIAPGQLL